MREAQVADVPLLLHLMSESCRNREVFFNAEAARISIVDLISRQDRGRIWVFQQRRESVGYMMVSLCESLANQEPRVVVNDIYVRQGFFSIPVRLLIDQAVTRLCREHGIHAYSRKFGRQSYLLTVRI